MLLVLTVLLTRPRFDSSSDSSSILRGDFLYSGSFKLFKEIKALVKNYKNYNYGTAHNYDD